MSCSLPSGPHIWPEARIAAGIEASMITSLGTCRLVMPLLESTIASGGRVAYTAWMSASIAALLIGRQRLDLRVDVADAVVGIDAEPLEHRRVLVEDVLVVGAHGVAEHDRVRHLHHGGLEVQREQHAPGFGVGDLGGEELLQRAPGSSSTRR